MSCTQVNKLAIEENNDEKLFLPVNKNALPDAEMPTLHQAEIHARDEDARLFSAFILGGRVRARAAAPRPRSLACDLRQFSIGGLDI